MPNISKQFGEKDTGSFEERFNRSIIRLTVLYATALAVILFVAGTASFSAFSARVKERFRAVPPPPTAVIFIIEPSRHLPTATEVREDFIESAILVNSALLVVGILFSYLLAKRTLQPIKDAYKKQQQFLSDASHELRTPISILQMELENEIALHGKTEEATSKLEEVQRMGTIVGDLLFLSRLDEGTHEYAFTPVDIVPLCTQTLDRLAPLGAPLEVTGAITTAASQVYIQGNSDLFLRAVTNIVKNAITYNKKGGTVSIDISEEGKQVLVRITDTGSGIATPALPRIFDRFYRIDESRSRGTGGSGLGLAIARGAIEKMNGTIAVASTLGEGTTFTIALPRSLPPEAESAS